MNFDLKQLQNVALVGATTTEEKYGNIIFKFLKNNTDYHLYPVNPNLDTDEILGIKVYPTLHDIPDKLDMVISVVPPKITQQILQQAIDLNIPRFWCQPGASTPEVEDLAKDKIDLNREECIMIALR